MWTCMSVCTTESSQCFASSLRCCESVEAAALFADPLMFEREVARDIGREEPFRLVGDFPFPFACWPSAGPCSFDAAGSSLHFQASANSPRKNAVRRNERMQAGLILIINIAQSAMATLRAHLRYNKAGCAALNTCMTVIVVTSPRTYAVRAA